VAIGDALGQPRRGLDWRSIQERFGTGLEPGAWVPEGQPGSQQPAGRIGELARLVIRLSERAGASGIRPRTGLLVDELLGMETLSSLPAQAAVARIRAGIEPTRSAVPELAGPEALYVAVPVGIASAGDPETAFVATRAIAGTILLGASLDAGQTFAAGVAAALVPGATPSSVLEAMLELAPPGVSRELVPASRFAFAHLGDPTDNLMPAIHDRFSARRPADAHGPAVESLVVASMLVYLSDGLPEQSLRAAASYGGWSHATTAAAGALAGCLSGASAFPAETARAVLSANPDVDIAEAARQLCRLIRLECERQRRRLEQIEQLTQSPAARSA
jgi:hypothetical protein